MPKKSAVIHDEISQQPLTLQLQRNVKDKIISLLPKAPQELEIVFDVLKHVDTQKNIKMPLVALRIAQYKLSPQALTRAGQIGCLWGYVVPDKLGSAFARHL